MPNPHTPDLFPEHPKRLPRPLTQAEEGRARRDDGIARAARHADDEVSGWQQLASSLLREFARAHESFTSEDVRAFAHDRGLPKPPDNRAWGAPMIRAVRDAEVAPMQYEPAKDPKVHRNPIMRWRSLIFRAAP